MSENGVMIYYRAGVEHFDYHTGFVKAADYEALRKRCEAVEARVAMAMHVLDKIDAGLGGETDDVRDALDPEEAIAAAQETSHG